MEGGYEHVVHEEENKVTATDFESIGKDTDKDKDKGKDEAKESDDVLGSWTPSFTHFFTTPVLFEVRFKQKPRNLEGKKKGGIPTKKEKSSRKKERAKHREQDEASEVGSSALSDVMDEQGDKSYNTPLERWVHLDGSNPAVHAWLENYLQCGEGEEYILRTLVAGVRPRVCESERGILVIIRGACYEGKTGGHMAFSASTMSLTEENLQSGNLLNPELSSVRVWAGFGKREIISVGSLNALGLEHSNLRYIEAHATAQTATTGAASSLIKPHLVRAKKATLVENDNDPNRTFPIQNRCHNAGKIGRVLSALRTHYASSKAYAPTIGDWLYNLTRFGLVEMSLILHNMREVVDLLEEERVDTSTVQGKNHMRMVKTIHQTSVELRRALLPVRDALNHLMLLSFSNSTKGSINEVSNTITRQADELSNLRERCLVIKDEANSLMHERLNKNMYVLSVVAAIFLPLSFITGLLGINVGGMPGADSATAFWHVVYACLGIAVFIVLVFKFLHFM